MRNLSSDLGTPFIQKKGEIRGGKYAIRAPSIREKGADKCAARLSARRERTRRLALSPAAATRSRRERRIPERLKKAGYPAARDVMTARTTNGVQMRQRAHWMRRTAMPRTVMEMAERSVVA